MTETLGIDIGGSGIKGAPVNLESGELALPRYRIATPQPVKPDPMAEIVGAIARYLNWSGPVGCGFPASLHKGLPLGAANIHRRWIGTDARQLFSAATGCPVEVVNDADAAGMAEMRYGAGRGRMGTVILVTIGTGLGTALFIDGVLFPNTDLGHIEIGGEDAEKKSAGVAREREKLTWKKWGGYFNQYLMTMEKLFWPDLFILGTDQKFNLLVGRELQREAGQEPQVIMTLPILEGLDGVQKMSKSLGNYIGIDEPPQTVFGKAMSIPDTMIVRYLELATAVPRDEIASIADGLQGGTTNPRDAKVRLAKALVAQYHSAQAADDAARWFSETFGARTFPADAPQFSPPAEALDADGRVWIVRLLTLSGAAPSGSEARRLIRQGGVEVDGEPVRDEDARLSLTQERHLQVGKRRFLRVCRP